MKTSGMPGRLAVILCGALLAAAAQAALNDTIDTPFLDYEIRYNDNPNNDDFFPEPGAQDIADAVDEADSFEIGDPNGFHAGFVEQGFLAPFFTGNRTVRIEQDFDGNTQSNDPAYATLGRIYVNTFWALGQSEPCLREVMGHELFHHVQFAYPDDPFAWGLVAMEGMAEAMQDRVYDDLDAGGCGLYEAQVAAIQGNPSKYLWLRDYDAALWWSWLAEQYGTDTGEPASGSDFIRTFFQQTQVMEPDSVAATREALAVYSETGDLLDIYQDFAIAAVAREYDASSLPDPDRYRFRDEAAPGDPPINPVVRPKTALASQWGPNDDAVEMWGAKYYEAIPAGACTGTISFVGESEQSDVVSWALLGIRAGAVEELVKGSLALTAGNRFATALVQDPAAPWDRVIAVAVGVYNGTQQGGLAATFPDFDADFSYAFYCGEPTLVISSPTASYPAYVGEPATPERFQLRVSVRGSVTSGLPVVEGLTPDDFLVYVGDVDTGNEAEVLTAAVVQGEYWLTVQPPAKDTAGPVVFPLNVEVAGVAALSEDAVIYETLIIDQELVIDRSASMLNGNRLESAKTAASAFVDSAQEDDKLGVVTFNGNDSEPDLDARVEHVINQVNDVSRDNAQLAIDAIVAAGTTSIGDGLELARQALAAGGSIGGENWIVLLSDGFENEGAFYADVAAALAADGVRVQAIALGQGTDQALLQQIVADTGGLYSYVTSASARHGFVKGEDGRPALRSGFTPLPNRLADAYAVADQEIRRRERIWEDDGTLQSGQTASHPVEVENTGFTEARVFCHWGNDTESLTVAVLRPDGTTVQDGIDGARIFTGDRHEIVHIPTLEPGGWKVNLIGGPGSPDYLCSMSGRAREGAQVDLYFGQYHEEAFPNGLFLRGLGQPIVAAVTDMAGPVLDATLVAAVEHPDGTVSTLMLLDDGRHGDGRADDGIYANVYRLTSEYSTSQIGETPPPPPRRGSYDVLVDATGLASGNVFHRIVRSDFQIFDITEPNPDDDFDGLVTRWEEQFPCMDPFLQDAMTDDDRDGLTAAEEFGYGTDPCGADTDIGGELDGSEVARGADPLDPADDAIEPPVAVGVVTHVGDFAPASDPLVPGALTLRYPVTPGYQQIKVLRSDAEEGPYQLVAQFGAAANGGLWRDEALIEDQPQWYLVQALDAAGRASAFSRPVWGTPRADAVPPDGWVDIAGGARYVDRPTVRLTLSASDDATEMLVSNRSAFDDASWQPFAGTLPWTLAPPAGRGDARRGGILGPTTVFVRFRDAAGNESLTVADSVVAVMQGSLGGITGTIELADAASPVDAYAGIEGGGATLADAGGDFELTGLLAGDYTVVLAREDYETVRLENVTVTAGSLTDTGLTVLPLRDTDGDGLADVADNCTLAANADQRDTDGDGIGNQCDPDFDGDCLVNFVDLPIFRAAFFTSDPDADFNGSGLVDFADALVMRSLFFGPPGPSGVPNDCDLP